VAGMRMSSNWCFLIGKTKLTPHSSIGCRWDQMENLKAASRINHIRIAFSTSLIFNWTGDAAMSHFFRVESDLAATYAQKYLGDVMRGMNLPKLPAPPSTMDECWKLYAQRLNYGAMPFPEASQLLTAYMAWPNDRRNRDRWMATNMAFFLAERSPKPN
jgi:hypothetical protein